MSRIYLFDFWSTMCKAQCKGFSIYGLIKFYPEKLQANMKINEI